MALERQIPSRTQRRENGVWRLWRCAIAAAAATRNQQVVFDGLALTATAAPWPIGEFVSITTGTAVGCACLYPDEFSRALDGNADGITLVASPNQRRCCAELAWKCQRR